MILKRMVGEPEASNCNPLYKVQEIATDTEESDITFVQNLQEVTPAELDSPLPCTNPITASTPIMDP